MRVILRAFGVAVLSLAALGAAQSPELDKARQEVERIRGLVAAGAAPRARLDAAWATLDDARDDAVLRSTLFGRVTAQDLSEEQSRNMLNAAQRRLDRQMARVEKAREMIAAGVTARVSMAPFLAELDLRRKTLDLAGSRARLFAEIVEQARAEQAALPLPDQPTDSPGSVVVRYDGAGTFAIAELEPIAHAFLAKFSHSLPVSASGETAVHKALGFDHRGRVDIALSPDQPEGKWLRGYLESHRIPYFAFRRAVPGKATAAHIHIGPPSPRLQSAD